jgi:FkbM family methyltransferase
MINTLKKFVREAGGPWRYGRVSYAQEGEDIVLQRFFDGKQDGFYVEIGCHHPFRFSNTYLFYKLRWSGICVDPLPGTKRLFNRWRPRDIVIETGVASERTTLTYWMFNEPALNTFDAKLAAERDATQRYKIVQKQDVAVDRLDSILERHLPSPDQRIDFLTIDVEGFDFEVIRSNDWQRYRPSAVVVESLNAELIDISVDPSYQFLLQRGYVPYAKTGFSIIFVTNEAA